MYSPFPVLQPLKALYTICHIHPIHMLMVEATMQGDCGTAHQKLIIHIHSQQFSIQYVI